MKCSHGCAHGIPSHARAPNEEEPGSQWDRNQSNSHAPPAQARRHEKRSSSVLRSRNGTTQKQRPEQTPCARWCPRTCPHRRRRTTSGPARPCSCPCCTARTAQIAQNRKPMSTTQNISNASVTTRTMHDNRHMPNGATRPQTTQWDKAPARGNADAIRISNRRAGNEERTCVCPLRLLEVPAGQSRHAAWPGVLENEPAGHSCDAKSRKVDNKLLKGGAPKQRKQGTQQRSVVTDGSQYGHTEAAHGRKCNQPIQALERRMRGTATATAGTGAEGTRRGTKQGVHTNRARATRKEIQQYEDRNPDSRFRNRNTHATAQKPRQAPWDPNTQRTQRLQAQWYRAVGSATRREAAGRAGTAGRAAKPPQQKESAKVSNRRGERTKEASSQAGRGARRADHVSRETAELKGKTDYDMPLRCAHYSTFDSHPHTRQRNRVDHRS
jgi:hypothetical protein